MVENFTGIILAGGQSTRMGMEKGLVPFNGKPLVQYSIDVLKVFCSEILISSNSDSYNQFGLKVVPDLLVNSGPMAGIYSCLIRSIHELTLVLSCDMPFVTPRIYSLLLDHAPEATIRVPRHRDELYEPLCGIYHRACVTEMEMLFAHGNFKLPDLFKITNFYPLDIPSIDPPLQKHYFFSMNSPEDLKNAEQFDLE